MTLLISSLRRFDVLLTADGRSTLRQGKVVTGFRDKTQKLFPVEGQSIVIGQHGQNAFHGQSISAIIKQFASELIPGLGIVEISKQLGDALRDEVRETLANLPSDTAAGVWVVGFGRGEDEPIHAEVFWKWEEDQFVTRESCWKATDVVMAGDGKKGLHVDLRDIEDASVATVESVHAVLMYKALNANVHPNTVGGHVHEVLVTPWGWKWTKPPADIGEKK
ncbi:MAG TPA: hypothetical protein VFE47_01265 [Tepidisphaeraceae bacterium]|jgi:hypothetical protein|nr:hypothetical protein [Tepidisphaeraceae bacterium]